MQPHANPADSAARRHRPKTLTVFAAAFVAGAVLAYGVNRVVDIHVVQVEPQVESEPIFVALRSLPQGSPITIYDVALKDWPKAMLPTTALKADACLEGFVLRHPIREGQPLLSVQLVRDVGPMPTTAVATLPPLGQPVATAQAATTERFVPALPADPPAVGAAPSSQSTTVTVGDQPVVPAPAVEVAATAGSAAAAVTDGTVAGGTDIDAVPPSESPSSTPEAAALVTVVDTVVESVDVPASEPESPNPVAEPTPAAAPTLSATPASAAEPTSASTPAASAAPTPAAVQALPAVAGDGAPLAPPVPALPTTDIERSLAGFGFPRAEPRDPAASVLDRSTEAQPPAPQRGLPKLHLVVPERIALAADASFTQPPSQAAAALQAAPARTAPRTETAATPSAARRSSATRPPAAQARPQSSRPQTAKPKPSAKPQPATSRGLSAWLPVFPGTSRPR